MEHAQRVLDKLEKFALSQPEFSKTCKKYGLPPGMVLAGILSILIVIGIIIQGYNIVVALITCVYPMIKSIETIQNGEDEATKKWLSFWTVFGIFQTLEMFIGFILNFIPYYSIVRLLFFLFLMLPQTNGSKIIYDSVFQPFLKKHQKEIEEFVQKVTTQASEYQKDFVDQA